MKEELMKLVEEIKQLELMLLAYKRKLSDLKASLSHMELKQTSVISAVVDADGKKMFSNEQSRKAELENWKSQSQEYKVLLEEFDKKEFEMQTVQIDLAKLEREFSAIKALCYFGFNKQV